MLGYREKSSDPQDVSNIATIVTEPLPVSDCFKTIDHVYTISSLMGFEACIVTWPESYHNRLPIL